MKPLHFFSNIRTVRRKAKELFGENAKVLPDPKKIHKYILELPAAGSRTRRIRRKFGRMGYEDYTVHHDKERRKRYRARASHIKGNWKKDPYSPNNLALKLLW